MKPILFSTPMVQAIQAGRKTMTRRVIKIDDTPENWEISIAGTSIVRTAPYDVKLARYNVGDILWVRETCWKGYDEKYHYKADYACGTAQLCKDIKIIPSIYMPREAARIFLRVTNVRVERLQKMPLLDVWSEGTPQMPGNTDKDGAVNQRDFQYLWDKLNAKRGYGWDKNPWVWVYEFERVSKDEAV